MKSYLVFGMTAGDAIFSLGQMKSVGEVSRVRGVHTGALAVVLWACSVDAVVLKAAMAIGPPVVEFLDSVLPPDAHELCRAKKVGILLRRQSSLWASPTTVTLTSWPSRGELIKTVAQAVWTPGWLNVIVAPGTAAGLACRSSAGIIVVGPQRATTPSPMRRVLGSSAQFDSWYNGGLEVPL